MDMLQKTKSSSSCKYKSFVNYLILVSTDHITLKEIIFLNTPITYVNAAARRIE